MHNVVMKALVLGGTGVIGTGIVRHLVDRNARVDTYSRRRRNDAQSHRHIAGDRSDGRAFERAFESARYDVVIDLVCYTPADADNTVRTFAGRCEHLLFCSTVCTYGVKSAPLVLVDERFPQEPVTEYGSNKLACERTFRRAAENGSFELTIVRPSHTYGPGGPLLDQLEIEGVAWDRISRGLPVLCSGDGLGLWQSTHRDDCAKLFAYAALNPKTYGKSYNATRPDVFTWRDYYREGAAALGTRAELIFAPSAWVTRTAPGRFRLLEEVTRFHGAYCSRKARADVPEFTCNVSFEDGARETFADLRRRGAWNDSSTDLEYDRLVQKSLAAGFERALA